MPDLNSGRTLDEIRNNLRDRYRSRLSVLKELLQNADDAGGSDHHANATQFMLCLSQSGLSAARHPLLRAPALIVFNDGRLRENDAVNIASMGRSSKAADGATIGRFGLGLKSVFRLCEAFFYFSSSHFANSDSANPPQPKPAGFLNPWAPFASLGRHPDWEEIWKSHADSDLQLLHQMRRDVFPVKDGRNWLGLWIPLRQSGKGSENVIYKEFCGHLGVTLDEVLETNWRDQLLEMLPLLRRLRGLEFKEQRDEKWWTVGRWSVEREYGVRFPEMKGSTSPEQLAGTVRIQDDGKLEKQAHFFGFEILSNLPVLQQLEASDKRPPQIQEDGSDGKVKAFPHGAAVFLRRPACGNATLHVTHAVFIPLSEGDTLTSDGQSNTICLPGNESFTLLLHGFYFVDAGRNKIAGMSDHTPEDEGDIQDEREFIARWNRALLTEAIWPLILPALREFTDKLKLNAPGVREIVKAMTATAEIGRNQKEICRFNQWVYCLSEDGPKWRLLCSNDEVYALPDLGQLALDELQVLFPCLAEMSRTVHFTLRDWPSLSQNVTLRCSAKLTAHILQATSASAMFCRPERIRYVLNLLSSSEKPFTSADVCREMRRLARERFLNAYEQVSDEAFGLIKELLMRMPLEQILCLDLADTDAGRLFLCRLSQFELPVLLLPRRFFGNDAHRMGAGKLNWPDAYQLFTTIAAIPEVVGRESDFDRQRCDLAREILQASERPQIWPEDIRDLSLFWAWDGNRNVQRAFTLRELERIQGAGTLFTGPANGEALPRKLQTALDNAIVVVLPRDLAKLLFVEVPQVCDAKTCLAVLEGKPTLSQKRLPLLGELLEALPNTLPAATWRCLRYLLHGMASRFEDDQPLFARDERQAASAMQRLAELALQATGCDWRLIPFGLVRELSGSQRERLSIRTIESFIVAQLVIEAGPATLDCSGFSASDKDALLLSLECEVLCQLNLHEDVAGKFVSVDKRSYLENLTFALPGDFMLARPIRVIKRHPNPVLSARQEQLGLRPLGRRAVIELALDEPQANLYWPIIMDALWGEGDELNDIPPSLRDAAWLPMANGHVVTPKQLLYLSGVEALATPILANFAAECLDPLGLLGQVRKHPGFKTFTRTVLPPPKDALLRLAGLLHKLPEYQLGLTDEWTEANTTDWTHVFGSPRCSALPSAELLCALLHSNEFKPHSHELLSCLAGRIPSERYVLVLNHLVSIHKEGEPEHQQRIDRVFDRYLKAAATGSEFKVQILPYIQLRSRADSWQASQNLTLEQNGVRAESTLSNQHAFILQQCLHRHDAAQLVQEFAEGFGTEGSLADAVRNYFAPWEGRLPRQVIGAFLALLGPRASGVVEQYLQPRRRNDILDKIQSCYPANLAWLLSERALQTRWVVGVSRGDRVQVESLIGKRISVPRSRSFQSLLGESRVATFTANPPPSVHGLMLLEITPEWFEQEELASLLEETTRVVLHHVYRLPGVNLRPLWEELTNSQGLDIEKAQYYLLNSALTILQQAGVVSLGPLKGILRRWDDALHREAEERRGIIDDLRRAPRDKEKIKEDLRSLLEGDTSVQQSILDALRNRVREHYHYSLDSIPFELWQNADDACVQLAKLSPDIAVSATAFVVRQSTNVLHFIHWGRLINQTRGTNHMDGRDWDFHRDLEKMLVFSISNKGDLTEQGQQLTGKFGLGFKSVLLACARPRVLSGDLAFDVVGGIYPMPLSHEQRDGLKALLPDTRQNGTVFELGLEPSVNAIELLARFRQSLPCLLVFAHHLREATVTEGGKQPKYLCWKPEPVEGVKDTVWGRLPEAVGEAQTALLFGVATDRGPINLLLGLCPSGFVALPKFVSGFWITTPTQESGEFGFAINGPFDPGEGRSRLAANSSRNEYLANLFGTALADRFTALYETLKTNVGSLKTDWNVSIDDYAFWFSFWRVLGVGFARLRLEGPASKLAQLALWDSTASGMKKFLTDCATLPTELFSDYRQLTRLSEVRFIARGCFQEKTVFELASGWPEFRRRVQPGKIVSEKDVGRFLNDLEALPPATLPISLDQVLDWELGDSRRLTEAQAARIGVLLNKEFFDVSHATGLSRISVEETKSLEGQLTSVLFQAQDSNWYIARELLNARSLVNSDESLRAAFAPPNRRLSETYSATAIALFEKCHEHFTVGAPAELSQWALAADSRFGQNAVLRYLLKGELRDRFARELQTKLADSWLTRLEGCQVFCALAPEDQEEIRDMLRLHRLLPVEVVTRTVDPSAVLEQIYNWWMHEADRTQLIRNYEARLYPHGRCARLDPDPERIRNDTIVRKGWLTLWLLGAFHTMGRTQDQQHRNFLELCEDRGWLDVFASPDSTQPEVRTDQLLKVLDHYFEDHGQWLPFYHWFRQFVTIYKVARWLPEYVEAYLGVERCNEPFSLSQIENPRMLAGFDAPPNSQAIGLGSCFIMRELVRFGLIRNPFAFEHCYVSLGRISRLWEQIGSGHGIYRGLCVHLGEQRATFAGAFDLPLLFVAENIHLQERFLNAPLPPEPTGEATLDEI